MANGKSHLLQRGSPKTCPPCRRQSAARSTDAESTRLFPNIKQTASNAQQTANARRQKMHQQMNVQTNAQQTTNAQFPKPQTRNAPTNK